MGDGSIANKKRCQVGEHQMHKTLNATHNYCPHARPHSTAYKPHQQILLGAAMSGAWSHSIPPASQKAPMPWSLRAATLM